MPPVIQMLIFAYAATQEVKNVRIAVLNQDTGILARDLVARFEGSTNFRAVDHLRADADIARAIDSRQRAHGGAHRPGLLAQRWRLDAGPVQLILDGRSSNAAQILGGYAQAIINGYNSRAGPDAAACRRRPASVVARVWFNPNLDAIWSTVPSLVAILVALRA